MSNIYDVERIEHEIEVIAQQNMGEIPEAMLEALVLAQSQSITQVENLVKYIRHLELGIEACNSELSRIQEIKNKASNRISSIKSYLTPFVSQSANGKVDIGTFKLSIRNSEAVIVDESLLPKKYMREKVTYSPAKDAIKVALQGGMEIQGAYIQKNKSLQIK